MSQPIKNREAFFDYLEEGLQAYFDNHDREWGGILHLTVGVKCGKVGGIIKGEYMLHYEGFALDRVREILKYVLPQYVSRSELPLAVDAVIDELTGRTASPVAEEQSAPQPPQEAKPKRKGGLPKKQNTKQANTEQQ
jgi:hypothetical protein